MIVRRIPFLVSLISQGHFKDATFGSQLLILARGATFSKGCKHVILTSAIFHFIFINSPLSVKDKFANSS